MKSQRNKGIYFLLSLVLISLSCSCGFNKDRGNYLCLVAFEREFFLAVPFDSFDMQCYNVYSHVVQLNSDSCTITYTLTDYSNVIDFGWRDFVEREKEWVMNFDNGYFKLASEIFQNKSRTAFGFCYYSDYQQIYRYVYLFDGILVDCQIVRSKAAVINGKWNYLNIDNLVNYNK